MKSIFLDTLNNKKISRPPVWFMRQAGRILPSYQKLKSKHSFSEMMNDPDLAAQVTLLPIKDLGVDAAILFSDILIVPEALGMGLEFTNKGPLFDNPLTKYELPSKELKKDTTKLSHVYDNISKVLETRDANTPLIGFCGGPLTTFCFMFRGNVRDTTFHDAIKFLYSNPKESMKILDALVDVSLEYVRNQAKSGIECFQLFETYSGLIPEKMYRDKILPLSKKILNEARECGLPTIFFPKNFGNGLNYINKDVCDYVSIDWQMDLEHARNIVDNEVGIQGNIDPRILFSSYSEIQEYLSSLIPFGQKNNDWIINLGHGFLPDINYKKARFVVEWIKETNWNR